jgi:1-deoxy-D-xylulose-5-phosphate reductoisomerase
VGLSAGRNVELLCQQAKELNPDFVAVSDPELALDVAAELSIPVLRGDEGVSELAGKGVHTVLNGITGAAGLLPTLAALEAGSQLALANKESLVIGGPVVKAAATPGQIVPVDSEHSAIAQALRSGTHGEVRRIILTASGGPFRGYSKERLRAVTVQDALRHPTWNMGRVVTINSATLVNKGLELIEAGYLFDVPLKDIVIAVHPQSVVHSMVEFYDGSTIAQASPPDMRLPIALGLGWPERVEDAVPPVDWTKANDWHFEPLDTEVFPAPDLARQVGEKGGSWPAVYNAANEIAVDAFCAGDIRFDQIVETVAECVAAYTQPNGPTTVASVLAADEWARTLASELVEAKAGE